MYCTQRSVESEHLFLAGKLFAFFSWIAWGNLQQQQKKKSVLVLFISFFFGGGVFGTAAADGFYLALFLSLSLSFAGGRVWKRDWKRRKKGEKGSIRYIS